MLSARHLLLLVASCTWLAPVTGQAAPRKIIAVFDIESSGVSLGKAALDRLGDYLTTKIAGAGEYQVVPRAQLRKRLRRQKRDSYKSCFDQSCQIEVGRELAAQKSLSTKILRLGGKCVVTTALYDLRKSATERAADSTGGCGIGALVRSIETAVLKLTGTGAAGPARPMGVVDRKHCPGPGSRRMGDPHPGGSYVWCVDKRGVRNGPSVQWHRNGQVAGSGRYRDNKQEGPWTTFHRNGRKHSQVGYRAGKRQGRFVRWDQQGNRSEVGQYRDGAKVGAWTRFDRDGTRRYQDHYANDDKQGPSLAYYADGKRLSACAYFKGERHGSFARWRRNGDKAEEGKYRSGKKEGRWVRHQRRGYYTEELYRDGKRNGRAVTWRNGKQAEVGAYRQDKRDGKWTFYRTHGPDHSKQREGTYRQGKMHGRWLTWRRGVVATEQSYRDGKRDGRFVVFGLGGDKLVEGQYKNGRKHGRWLWLRRGQITKEILYNQGQRVGG